MFRCIASDNFPPFKEIRLELPPVENCPAGLAEVHLFTGVNGTGKTRLLSVLAGMLGNPNPLRRRLKGITENVVVWGTNKESSKVKKEEFGTSFGGNSSDLNWTRGGPLHQWAEKVPAFAYSGTAYVSDAAISVMAEIPRPDRVSCLSFVRPENDSQGLLQAITNLKLQAAMDTMNETGDDAGGTRATRIIKALETTIQEITGHKFLFHVTTYPKTNLMVRWAGAELSFDVLPDGLRSLIGWLIHAVVMMDVWLQGKGDPMQTEAVFLLDEIESSLHPAWQRRVLPAFQRLFPKSQIFVATHSPFLIASLNHGWIHPLTMSPDGSVKVEQPVKATEGDSYVSVVEDIMGLKEWYDPETEQLLTEFRTMRDAAYNGHPASLAEARKIAGIIGKRSMELDYMMGKELSQMDRQFAKASAGK
jgi:energy-coupling factor transporter ATP-binding protein EcfA2